MSKKPTSCYDSPSFSYHKYWETRKYEDQSEKIAIAKLLKLIPNKKNKSIIDVASGYGRLTPKYAPLFEKCLLVEPSKKLFEDSLKLKKEHQNLQIERGFLKDLNLKNENFDVALLIRVLHHLEDPEKLIKEIDKILKPKGFLILEFANKIHLKNRIKAFLKMNFGFFTEHKPKEIHRKRQKTLFFNYHPNQIKTILLSNNFKIIKCLSVSNLRHPLVKKIFPFKILLFIEKIHQSLSGTTNSCMGPSLFILAQKK